VTENPAANALDVPRSLPDFESWWSRRQEACRFQVSQIPFRALDQWYFDQDSGNLRHRSGRFFAVEGVWQREDTADAGTRPILHQSEVGILGFLLREVRGVPQVLVQAKAEPGNINGLQISPTVQATRSNYMRVHRGADTRYLEYFQGRDNRRVLVDSLQSEQGEWFFRKRNRNMLVMVRPDIPVYDDFHWLDLGLLRGLLGVENLVGMDARSVLSCTPFSGPRAAAGRGQGEFLDALAASYTAAGPETGALHTETEILSWFTEAKAASGLTAQLIPLNQVRDWTRSETEIADSAEDSFKILAVDIDAPGREVASWNQPMLAPAGRGIAVFLARRVNGVLHVLVQALAQHGLRDGLEVAPTVQLPGAAGSFLEQALTEDVTQVRFDTVLSEEGGRFYHALTRYRVIETAEAFPAEAPEAYCWLTVRQLMDLVRHGHYLTVEARSLLACLHSLW
jgi:dTDP-4-dehydro-6-deoxy-alpha-D-glucopyranose 2,3-dehydratase